MKKLIFAFAFIAIMILYAAPGYAQQIYQNSPHSYSITVPDAVYTVPPQSSTGSDEDTVTFKDTDGILTAVINSEKIEASSILAMRKYLDDYSSSDNAVFNKIAELKESYVDALDEVYRNEYLFGSSERTREEKNIKIIRRYSEQSFGTRSSVVLYNEISVNNTTSDEDTHITITIPSSINKTIYTMQLSVKRGFLTEDRLQVMSGMVKSLKILDRPATTSDLKVFSDMESIETANQGIYPNLRKIKAAYTEYENTGAGYKITYPSSFMPYHRNNIIDSFDYKSFKINYFHQFNITVQPAFSSEKASVEKINAIKETEKFGTVIADSGIRKFNGIEFYYIKYSLKDSSGEIAYLQDYYVTHGGSLYRIQLNSRFIRPSFMIENEFLRTIHSFEFVEKVQLSGDHATELQKFVSPEEGYSFSYPSGWVISGNTSKDINYNLYYVKNTDFSGPLDIYVSEGELKQNVSVQDIKELISEFTVYDHDKLFIKYDSPYTGKANKLLSSSISSKEDAVYLYRLVNYLDTNNRIRLCYSVDIIRGKKVTSLFISVGEYITVEGRITDKTILSAINRIAGSFSAENTPEYLERLLKGETRNKKVISIENYIKGLLGETANVTSTVYVTSPQDILVKVSNVQDGGYYRITASNTSKDGYTVTGRLLYRDIFEITKADLLTKYSSKVVDEIGFYENDMSVDIEYRKDEYSQALRDTYSVKVETSGEKLGCRLIKKP